jgi:CHAD domain-containing protein
MFSASAFSSFQPDETIKRGFLRMLDQRALQARCLVRRPHGPQPESVHETRVLIKWLRALLWFARPAFSSGNMERVKANLRRASHLLAPERDLVVMRSILKRLSQNAVHSAYRKALARIVNTRNCWQAKNGDPGQSLREAAGILLTTVEQIKRAAKTNSRWPSCSHRFAQAFTAVHKSGKEALKSGDSTQFHDWRKKAKRLLFQLQLTQAVPGNRLSRAIQQVNQLQAELGDYHDCVIVQDCLQKGHPIEVPPPVMKHTVDLLELRKSHLRKEVRQIAKQIESR